MRIFYVICHCVHVYCFWVDLPRRMLEGDEKDIFGWVSSAMIHLRAHLDSIPLAVARTEVQITLAVPAKPGSFSRALVCPPVCVCGCVWVSMGESLCVSVCFFLPCSPFRFLGSGFECIFFFFCFHKQSICFFHTHTLSLSLHIYDAKL